MFLSIIIPAYNAEKYIKRCVESCLLQDIPISEYELIIINDGSTDNTGQILDQLTKRYSNITTYTQKNSGPSIARNLGIQKATGDYIWFIDADDSIEPYCLKKIHKTIIHNKLDSLGILWDLIDEKGRSLSAISQSPPQIFNSPCCGEIFFNQYAGYGLLSIAFIHKRDTIIHNNLFFPKNIKMCEDAIFNINVLIHMKSVYVLDSIVYHYYQYTNSLINTINPQKPYNQYNILREIILLYQRYPNIKLYLLKFISHSTISNLICSIRCKNEIIPIEISKLLLQNNINKLKYSTKKYYIFIFTYNLNPILCLLLIKAVIKYKRVSKRIQKLLTILNSNLL